MRVRTSSALVPRFLEAVLLSARAREYLSSAARGTSESMVKINRDLLADLRIQMPPIDEQEEIVRVLGAVTDRRRMDDLYIEGLRATKSALMSVLLTGELRVTPAEVAA